MAKDSEKQKEYWLVIRQGETVTKVKTTDPGGDLATQSTKHKKNIENPVNPDDGNQRISVEIHDGDTDPNAIENGDAIPKIKGGGADITIAVDDMDGVGETSGEKLNNALSKADPDYDTDAADKKEGNHKITLTIVVDGEEYTFTAESDESLEDAVKKAKKEALKDPNIDQDILENSATDKNGKRKASFEIEYEGPDHDEDDDPVKIKANSFAALVIGLEEETNTPLSGKVLKNKEVKKLRYYAITVDGKRYVGFGYNLAQAREDAESKKVKFEKENKGPFIATKDKETSVIVEIGSLADHNPYSDDPKERGPAQSGKNEKEAAKELENFVRGQGSKRNKDLLNELELLQNTIKKDPIKSKGEKTFGSMALKTLFTLGTAGMTAAAALTMKAALMAALGVASMGWFPSLLVIAAIAIGVKTIFAGVQALFSDKHTGREFAKSMKSGWIATSLGILTAGAIDQGAIDAIKDIFNDVAPEGVKNFFSGIAQMFSGGDAATAGTESNAGSGGADVNSESSSPNGVEDLSAVDWTEPQDLGQVNTDYNSNGFENGIKELEDGSKLIKTLDGKLILVETTQDELAISKPGQGEVRIPEGDINIDADGRVSFIPVEAQPTKTAGNLFNFMNRTPGMSPG